MQREGFGVLTEVDVTSVLRQKLGVESVPYRLLGVCNPSIAHRAMTADARVGAFLPCGLALYEASPGETTVCLQNPGMIAASFDATGLASAAEDALERLARALASTGEPQ